MQQYHLGDTKIMYKVIKGKPHPFFRKPHSKNQEIGIAFRTADAPIGYLPFYDKNDFDFSGATSWKERILGNFPVNMSAAASPYTILLQYTTGDVEFLGAGDPDLIDIQENVRGDLTSHALTAAGGVFVDGVMLALGGPGIKHIVNQFSKSLVKRFLVSKAISTGVKRLLKEQYNLNVD